MPATGPCVTHEKIGPVSVLRLQNMQLLDQDTWAVVEQAIAQASAGQPLRWLVLNMGQVDVASSLVWASVIRLACAVSQRGGRAAVCGMRGVVAAAAKAIGLARLADLYADEPQAVAALQKIAGTG